MGLEKHGDREQHAETIVKPLRALDAELDGKEYLVGNRFTVADLNLGSIIAFWGRVSKINLSACPNIVAWSARINERPAFKPPKKTKLENVSPRVGQVAVHNSLQG